MFPQEAVERLREKERHKRGRRVALVRQVLALRTPFSGFQALLLEGDTQASLGSLGKLAVCLSIRSELQRGLKIGDEFSSNGTADHGGSGMPAETGRSDLTLSLNTVILEYMMGHTWSQSCSTLYCASCTVKSLGAEPP